MERGARIAETGEGEPREEGDRLSELSGMEGWGACARRDCIAVEERGMGTL